MHVSGVGVTRRRKEGLIREKGFWSGLGIRDALERGIRDARGIRDRGALEMCSLSREHWNGGRGEREEGWWW